MSELKGLQISIPAHIRQRMADDPKLAAELREMIAAFHQAHHAVLTGQYKTLDDAMKAITGQPMVDLGDSR